MVRKLETVQLGNEFQIRFGQTRMVLNMWR